MRGRLVLWRWIVFGVVMAPFLYQALYPRWVCVTGSGRYVVHPSLFPSGRRKSAITTEETNGYPPNQPMVTSPRLRRTVVRAPLWSPPRQVDGQPCRAEVDWDALQPWLIGGGVTALGMLFVLAKIGERPCTDPGSHSS